MATDTQLFQDQVNALVAEYNANRASNAAIMADLQALMTQDLNVKITPQANGDLVSNFSGGGPPPPPPPNFSTIPNFTSKAVGFTVDLAPYVNNAFTSLQLKLTVSNWSLVGTVLTCTGVGSGSMQVQAIWAGTSLPLSNIFTVQSIGALALDTVPPTIPTGVQLALIANSNVVMTFNPSSDPAPPSITWSGLHSLGYHVQRSIGLGPLTGLLTVPAPTKGVQFFATPQDIGAPATPGTTTQTGGASFLMTGFGAGYYGVADQGQMVPFAVTGNFTVTLKVSAFTCANQYAKCGVDARAAIDAVNGAGSPHVLANVKPLAGGIGGGMDYRPTQGGTTANTVDVAQTANTALWMMLTRVGNVFTQWISTDPNALGAAAAQVGQATVVLPAQLFVGPVCAANGLGATAACTIDQWNITQDPALSVTDSAVSPGNTYNYRVSATDIAGNASAFSPVASITFPPSGGGGGGPPPTGLLAYLQGLKAAGTKHILAGQITNVFGTIGAGGGSLVTPIPGRTGGKQIAVLGTCNDWNNSGGSPDFISESNAWLARGGIVFVTQDCHTFAYNSPSDYWTPGTATNTAFTAYLRTQVAKFKQINGTVIWRPFTEPNGNHFGSKLDPNGPQTALNGQYNAHIFQYTHDYCISQGLNNVLWAHNLNFWDPNNLAHAYYPGDAYVDVVSIDSYPPDNNSLNPYNFYVTTGKPIFFGEWGVHGNGASGAMAPILQTVKNTFPKCVGMMCWCQQWAMLNMTDISAFMNDPAIITLADIPAGI